jgi:WhiB family redox-sensing transcriptional regulator
MDLALCTQTDPEAFFPEKGESAADAKKVCAKCEVPGDCLIWALRKPQKQDLFGIAGGLTVDERRKLRRQQKAAA